MKDIKYTATIAGWVSTYKDCMALEQQILQEEEVDIQIEDYVREKSKLMSCLTTVILAKTVNDNDGTYIVDYAKQLLAEVDKDAQLNDFDKQFMNEELEELIFQIEAFAEEQDDNQSEDE